MTVAPQELRTIAIPEPALAADTSAPPAETDTTMAARVAVDRTALVERTLNGIEAGLKTSETASIAQVVELIREMALKVDSLSVHQVGEILSRDLTITAKLIKVACTVAYNPDGADIATINQAIASVGYNRVRNMAVSLLLLKNANRRWSTDDFDEIACTALTSALMSETITENRKSHNPEHAFVSAALRNYGRLLLASFYPEEYREAMTSGEKVGFEKSIRDFFGMTSLELSKELLRRAKLPQSLLRFIEPVPENRFSAEELSRDDQQAMLVEFTGKFCELLSRLKNQDQFQAGYRELMERYGRALSYTKEDMKALLEATMAKVESYKRQLASPLFSNRIVTNISAFLEDRPLTLQPAAVALAGKKQGPVNATFTCGLNAEKILRAGLRELDPIVNAPAPDHTAVWQQVTRLVWRALDLDDTLLLLQPPCSPAYQAEYGFGQQAATFKTDALVDPNTKTIFTVCITRAQDVIIQNPHDKSIQPFIPAWLKAHANGGIALFPFSDQQGTFAVLMGLARAKHTFSLSPRTKEHLRSLKALLGILRPKAEAPSP